MKYIIGNTVAGLRRYKAAAIVGILTLTLISGLASASIDPDGRKSRGGRWTALEPGSGLLVSRLTNGSGFVIR